MAAETTARKPRGRPFQPGNNANPNGRPVGSRNRLAEDFLKDVLADWQEGGKAVLSALRTDKPDVYVKVVADLLPKIEHKTEDVNVTHSGAIEHRGLPEIGERVAEILAGRAENAGAPLCEGEPVLPVVVLPQTPRH